MTMAAESKMKEMTSGAKKKVPAERRIIEVMPSPVF
jgi:hypothetical protein